jgi:hypothetical protein
VAQTWYSNKIKLTLNNVEIQAYGFLRQHLHPLSNISFPRVCQYMIQAGTHAPNAAWVTPSGGNARLDRERTQAMWEIAADPANARMQAVKALMFNKGTPVQVERRAKRREAHFAQMRRFFGAAYVPPAGGPGTRDDTDPRDHLGRDRAHISGGRLRYGAGVARSRLARLGPMRPPAQFGASFEPLGDDGDGGDGGDGGGAGSVTYPPEWDEYPEWKVDQMRAFGQQHGALPPDEDEQDEQSDDDVITGVEKARWAAQQRVIEEDYGTDDDEWIDPYAGVHFSDVAELAASMRPAAAAAADDAEAAAAALVAGSSDSDEDAAAHPSRQQRRRRQQVDGEPQRRRQRRRRQLFRCAGATGTTFDPDAGQDGEHPSMRGSSAEEEEMWDRRWEEEQDRRRRRQLEQDRRRRRQLEQDEQEELSPPSHRTPPSHLGDAYANAVAQVQSSASAGAAAPHPDDVASGAATKWMMMATGCDDTRTAAAGGPPLLYSGVHTVEEASAAALSRGGTFLDDGYPS